MLLSLLLSSSADTNKSGISGLGIRGETSILFIRLEEDASPRIIKGLITRLFIIKRMVVIGGLIKATELFIVA